MLLKHLMMKSRSDPLVKSHGPGTSEFTFSVSGVVVAYSPDIEKFGLAKK